MKYCFLIQTWKKNENAYPIMRKEKLPHAQNIVLIKSKK